MIDAHVVAEDMDRYGMDVRALLSECDMDRIEMNIDWSLVLIGGVIVRVRLGADGVDLSVSSTAHQTTVAMSAMSARLVAMMLLACTSGDDTKAEQACEHTPVVVSLDGVQKTASVKHMGMGVDVFPTDDPAVILYVSIGITSVMCLLDRDDARKVAAALLAVSVAAVRSRR